MCSIVPLYSRDKAVRCRLDPRPPAGYFAPVSTTHDPHAAALAPVRFETSPGQYRHWKLAVEGAMARLSMDVQEDQGLRPGYELKLNSYDLGVDLELSDAINR